MSIRLHHIGLMLAFGLSTSCGQKPEPVTPVAPVAATGDTAPSGKLQVANFSPDKTPAGVPFNVQADGNSGISFELDRPAPPADFAVWFDGKPLTGVVAAGKIVTATIPVEYLAEPGRYPIELEVGGIRIPAGDFVVEAP